MKIILKSKVHALRKVMTPYDPTVINFDSIPASNRQMDGRTDTSPV